MEDDLGMQMPLIEPKGTKGRFQQLQMIYKKPDFLVTWIFPWVIFAIVLLFHTYLFMKLPSVCIIISIAFALVGVVLLLMRSRGHVYFPLGVTTLAAVSIGTLVGLFVYETYACFPMFYSNSRLYTNIMPSQPSSSVADARGITFAGNTVVDTQRSSGFISESGYVYCAAPILDNSEMARIDFWAVGVDCCGPEGGFHCDQSQSESAKAGIRVFDNSGWFTDSNFDFYVRARKKVESTYGLVSVPEPLFLRWVTEDNLSMLSNQYSTSAALAVVGFILVYAVLAAGLSFALYRPRPAKPKAQWPPSAYKAL